MSGLTMVSPSWLRRLGIGEPCSVWREKGGKKGRAGVRCVCVNEGGKRKGFGPKGKGRKEGGGGMTNYDRRVPGRCLRV